MALRLIVWLVSTVFFSDNLLSCYLLSHNILSVSSELVFVIARIQNSSCRQVICVGTGLPPCDVSQIHCNNIDLPGSTAHSRQTARFRRCTKFQIQIPRWIQRARRRKRQKLWLRQKRKLEDAIRAYKWPYQDELYEIFSFDDTLGFPGEGWKRFSVATWNVRSLTRERFDYSWTGSPTPCCGSSVT